MRPMRIMDFSTRLSFAAFLAGPLVCAFLHALSPAEAAGYSQKVLHSFCSEHHCKDGAYPAASLIEADGILYGSTVAGGGTGCSGAGCGTVFSIDPNTGAEKTIYSFCRKANCRDGAYPSGNLIEVNGTLYGTATAGGKNIACGNSFGCGAVFALNPESGEEQVLYSFCKQSNDHYCLDGSTPSSGVIDIDGILYGTTESGGAQGEGTVFSLEVNSREERVLYSFCVQQNCTDGRLPEGNLVPANGLLYGTTGYGGSASCDGSGCGTLFSIDPNTGAEAVVYSFCTRQDCADGERPLGNMIDANGRLYGSTLFGGNRGCFGDGCGTVFAINPDTATEEVLYAFCHKQFCADGALPFSGPIAVKGRLYGTTAYGGRTGCPQTGDCGTVFSIDTATATENVLYAFCSRKNCKDGWGPEAGLISADGALYGTVNAGGTHDRGTVFALTKN